MILNFTSLAKCLRKNYSLFCLIPDFVEPRIDQDFQLTQKIETTKH